MQERGVSETRWKCEKRAKEETMSTDVATLEPERLDALLGQAVVEFGATVNAALVVIGDRLGLYRALAGAEALSSTELAERTGTAERYVREWLNAQAASGYVEYDAATGRYTLSPEQAAILADESSPAFVGGGFQVALGAAAGLERIQDAFLTGAGMGWHEHHDDVFEGCQRFFEPGYRANIIDAWIPALEGVPERLEAGGRVADVGCGHGASSIVIAERYRSAEVIGFDYHDASIAQARRRAEAAGVADRVRFEVAAADAFPGASYDLVACFDCLHDMGDPVAVARHVRGALADDGTWMIVEPYAGDRIEDNLNPVGRAYYAFSTMLCTPNSLSQAGGLALGAQAGAARLREVVTAGGFTRFRRAAETPFNLVLEARP
jgi:ubiquinone/menaquinone biosynthesis C-methylase UbiE